MVEYRLEDEADQDLLEIGRYTERTWSLEQADRYLSALEDHFEAITRNDVLERQVFEHREDVHVSRCQQHYIFFVRGEARSVVILAILHKNMNLIARLRRQFESGGLDV